MAVYSFLKEAKVYLVQGSTRYPISINNVSFSQTFTEQSYEVKNLHTSDIFEGSVINTANPANFSLVVPMFKESKQKVLFDALLDYSTFDLYIQTLQDTFKLEYCVISNGSFAVEKGKNLLFSVSGEASKLTRIGNSSYTIPGTLNVSLGETYLLTQDNSIVLGSEGMSEHTLSCVVEFQNEIEWIPYKTLQQVVDNTTMYPSDFVVINRILAGSFSRYINPETVTDTQTYSQSSSLRIKIGQEIGGTFYGFDFNMGSCSYTNRINTGSVFTQNYDWRMTDNTTLSNIITYTTT